MKKLLSCLLFTSAAFCQWKNYDVHLQDNKNTFSLCVITEKDQPSMGSLVISNLKITRPQEGALGAIAMDLSLDPDSLTRPVLGPRDGCFTFQKGKALPEIINGEYEIIIDGVDYGHIQVDAHNSSFFPLKN
ncbi:MAG: hypothetical protein PVI40_00240 [Chlamydiota bacterium]|jgi:hypothetical protein